jgi:hypothetical protein
MVNKKELQTELGKRYESIRERETFWVEFIKDGAVGLQHGRYLDPSYSLCRSIAKHVRRIGNGEINTVYIGAYYFQDANNWGY